MTDSDLTPPPATDTWEGILAALRRRYPGQKDSVLFCIYKLQHNPELTLKDFRAEAELHGIPMAGRALHSARVLLGLQKEEPAAPAAPQLVPPLERITRQRRHAAGDDSSSIEDKVLAAVRQIQSSAGAQSEHLRTAIRQAITILQRALDA